MDRADANLLEAAEKVGSQLDGLLKRVHLESVGRHFD